ncbi:hypothetical protein F0919_03775 [Taibaiella lutea]|uniref:RHS repeat protein n=1 Tax=Taibaiella lutea TaxID=2608001 RepID=A0A5M6CUD2_9BACT|nr:hypothetical protein [Taibaiella lutea]KAA5536799.1 hypothetical protein F0919_03775 [Taibaiella lutea]
MSINTLQTEKAFVLVLLFLSITNAVNAQTKVKSDLDYRDLKGPVKKIRSHIYDISDSTGKQEKVWVYSETELFNKAGNYIYDKDVQAKTYFNDSTHYTYDSLQNLVVEEVFEEHNVLEKRVVSTYNQNRQTLTEMQLEYDVDDDSGQITDTFIHTDRYTYNDLNLTDEIWRSALQSDGTIGPYRLYIKNVYEDSGRICYQYEYRSSENPAVADTSYTRKNNAGQVVKSYNSQTSFLDFYDSLGRIIKLSSLMLRTDSVYNHIVFTYDKWGNKNSTTTYDNSGKIIGAMSTSTFYDIDRRGNWRKVKGYRGGKLTYYCERKIEYY